MNIDIDINLILILIFDKQVAKKIEKYTKLLLCSETTQFKQL